MRLSQSLFDNTGDANVWLMFSDCFFSIVSKDCERAQLCVRARRKGDIEKIWPRALVTRSTDSDYLFRAFIDREQIATALTAEVRRIAYGNFKDSVKDKPLHDAYLRVWTAMAALQNPAPYSDRQPYLLLNPENFETFNRVLKEPTRSIPVLMGGLETDASYRIRLTGKLHLMKNSDRVSVATALGFALDDIGSSIGLPRLVDTGKAAKKKPAGKRRAKRNTKGR